MLVVSLSILVSSRQMASQSGQFYKRYHTNVQFDNYFVIMQL